MKTIKAKVHRLPTEDSTNIGVAPDGSLGYASKEKLVTELVSKMATPQHLYITTDEEIKEGDWCYLDYGIKFIGKAFKGSDGRFVYHELGCDPVEEYGTIEGGLTPLEEEVSKIIATTDPKLKKFKVVGPDGTGMSISLPQPSQSFIEEYCKAGGIDEVLVEVECLTSTHTTIVDWSKEPIETEALSEPKCIEYRIKLNPDNTIIIHPVEEKMYNRDEVGSKIKEFVKEYAYEWSMDDINEWIEENL